MAGGYGWSSLIGIGQAVHAENEKRDEVDRQKVLNQENDDRSNFNAAIQMMMDAGSHPNATPETVDYAHRTALDWMSRGRKNVKPTEIKSAWQNLGNINMQARKAQINKTLGIQSQAADRITGVDSSTPDSAVVSSGGDPSFGVAGAMLHQIVTSPESVTQPVTPSSSPYYTQEEQTQRSLATLRSQEDLKSRYEWKEVPQGGTLVQPATGRTITGQPKKLTDKEQGIQRAYREFVLNHPELGLHNETDVEQKGFGSKAVQEYADRATKSTIKGGGERWVADPFDPTQGHFVPIPTTTVRPGGGQPGGAAGSGAGGADGGSNRSVQDINRNTLGTPTGEEYIAKLPKNEQNLIRMMGEYRLPPAQLSGFGGAARIKLMNDVGQAYPGFDAKEYNARFKFMTDLLGGAGQNGQALQSINKVIHHMDTLNGTFSKLKNAQLPAYNTVANWISTQAGKKAVNNFNIAADTVSTELGKVMRGTGVLSQQEIKDWRKNLSASMSPEQFRGALDTLMTLLGGRLEALDEAWHTTMGNPRDRSVLFPTTVKALQRMKYNPEDIDSASSQPLLTTRPSQVPTPAPMPAPAPAPAPRPTAQPQQPQSVVPNRAIPPPPPGFQPVQ